MTFSVSKYFTRHLTFERYDLNFAQEQPFLSVWSRRRGGEIFSAERDFLHLAFHAEVRRDCRRRGRHRGQRLYRRKDVVITKTLSKRTVDSRVGNDWWKVTVRIQEAQMAGMRKVLIKQFDSAKGEAIKQVRCLCFSKLFYSLLNSL